jgi:hypothetical protein
MIKEPNHAPLDWALLRSFVAVMRHGTLSAAAASIGQTQPTIGRHIRSLEAAIGEPWKRQHLLLSAMLPVAAIKV